MASNQVQVIPWAWFMMKAKPSKVIIHPEIVGKTGKKTLVEGCFSCDHPAEVKRATAITVSYIEFDIETKSLKQVVNERIEGFNARVFLHEFDHLLGKTI